MSPLQMVVASLSETWPVTAPQTAAALVTLASLSQVFTAPPALTLNQFAYTTPGGTS